MATIKAGTYRFNDVLTQPPYGVGTHYVSTNLTVHTAIDSVTAQAIKTQLENEGVQADFVVQDYSFVCAYSAMRVYVRNDEYESYFIFSYDSPNVSFEPYDPVVEQLAPVLLLSGDEAYHPYFGWKQPWYQTITIPTDTEVSAEFAEWFTANAVADGVQISGKWKFNDVLTAPSGNLEQGASFSVADVDYEITQEMADQFAQYYGITVPVGSFTASGNFSGISVLINSSNDVVVNYDGGVFRADDDRYSALVQAVLTDGDKEVYNETGGYYWDSGSVPNPQTIDFGTEPQTISAEFYSWLTANATQPMASVSHNGEAIASLFPGQTATLKCAGMKMAGDVVVSVAVGGAVVEDYDGTITIV